MNTSPDKLSARESFLADVLTLAAQPGVLDSWAAVLHHERWTDAAPHGGADSLLILQPQDAEVVDVTPPILSRVFREFATNYQIPGLALATRNRVLDARRDNDASRLTPEDASVVLQVLIYGKVVA